MMPIDVMKKRFEQVALSYLNTPYLWGGDDPSGIDCSGFVLNCLRSIGFVGAKEDMTADTMWKKWKAKEISAPQEMALIFYFRPDGVARHVTICLDQWFEIGADGGGSQVTNIAEAWKANAFVKISPIDLLPNVKFVNLF